MTRYVFNSCFFTKIYTQFPMPNWHPGRHSRQQNLAPRNVNYIRHYIQYVFITLLRPYQLTLTQYKFNILILKARHLTLEFNERKKLHSEVGLSKMKLLAALIAFTVVATLHAVTVSTKCISEPFLTISQIKRSVNCTLSQRYLPEDWNRVSNDQNSKFIHSFIELSTKHYINHKTILSP